MAAVSAPLASGSLTPPTHGHGAWDYSVPLSDQQLPPETAANYNDYENHGARQTLTGQTNGHSMASKGSRTDLYKTRPSSRSSQLQNQGYSTRIDITNRKMGESGNGDSYSPSFHNGGALNGTEHSPTNGRDYDDDSDPEHSRWIHKDKLERMEIQEMERLGIRIPRSRPGSRSNRSRSRDKQNSAHNRNDQQRRQKIEAIPTEEEEGELDWDLRLPEERNEGRDLQDPQWEQTSGSKPVSRIPVNKKSPVPIPVDFLERDTPMQYGRSLPTGTEEGISYSKSRGRSGSVKALEDSVVSSTAKPTPRSVSGRRVATDVSPTKKTGPRKTSAPANRTNTTQQRPKTRSGSGSNGTRPVTRSGDFGSISKRPEGDPPWLATMYKPDPRLPPDQQILPTHAKRMQQEQWEKDGKFGNTYDTDFRPLNDEEFTERAQPSPIPEPVERVEVQEQKPELQRPEQQPGWPLLGPKSPTSPTLSTGRPGTAGGGSYSTMPKIASSIRPHASPLPSPSITQTTTPLRLPEPPQEDEKQKKEAGCACCIVM